MALQNIEIKAISELPSHQLDRLKSQVGAEEFERLQIIDALVEIRIVSSTPHIDSVKPFSGTFSDRILCGVNGGKPIADIFRY